MEVDEIRNMALFVVAQIPKMKPADMLAVLGASQALVKMWYCQSAEVIPFPESASGSAPRALTTRKDKPPSSP